MLQLMMLIMREFHVNAHFCLLSSIPVANCTRTLVQAKKAKGLSQANAADVLGLGIATVKRHWKKSMNLFCSIFSTTVSKAY